MHNIWTRLNNLAALLSSCLMGLAAVIALSSFLIEANTAPPKGTVAILGIRSAPARTPHFRVRNQDVTFTKFNITADLTPLFHYNTKQVFVYLQAEYTNSQEVRNEVVIWDKIIHSKDEARLNLVDKHKYAFRELSTSFANIEPASYTLKYNIMPYVGLLTYGEAARTKEPVPFPEVHSLD
ncbi:signal peptidase 22kDa subunit [Schizophyllum fasciatum]